MKNAVKLVVIGALIAFVATELKAQTTVTNIVQNLTIKYTAYYQMDPTTGSSTITLNAGKVSIANSDIIALLGLQLNTVFTSNAKLLLMSDIQGEANPKVDMVPRVVVRDTVAGSTVDTAVGDFFTARILSSVESGKIKLNPLNVSGTAYEVMTFNMVVNSGAFNVQGFVQSSVATVKYQGQMVGEAHTGTVNVAGQGTYSASAGGGQVDITIKGTVQVSGKNVEVSTTF